MGASSEMIGSVFVAIPRDLLARILSDGYHATIRNAVPLSGTPTEAIHAFNRHHSGDVIVLTVQDLTGDLTVVRNAMGAPARLNSRHLPGECLAHVYYSVGQDGPPIYEWEAIEEEKRRVKNETGKQRVRVHRHHRTAGTYQVFAYNTKTKTWA